MTPEYEEPEFATKQDVTGLVYLFVLAVFIVLVVIAAFIGAVVWASHHTEIIHPLDMAVLVTLTIALLVLIAALLHARSIERRKKGKAAATREIPYQPIKSTR